VLGLGAGFIAEPQWCSAATRKRRADIKRRPVERLLVKLAQVPGTISFPGAIRISSPGQSGFGALQPGAGIKSATPAFE
jgi:hypothetical protein